MNLPFVRVLASFLFFLPLVSAQAQEPNVQEVLRSSLRTVAATGIFAQVTSANVAIRQRFGSRSQMIQLNIGGAPKFFVSNRRVQDRCGSMTYFGNFLRNEADISSGPEQVATIEVTDHRRRICRDMPLGAVEVRLEVLRLVRGNQILGTLSLAGPAL